jgi:hypothetical protein
MEIYTDNIKLCHIMGPGGKGLNCLGTGDEYYLYAVGFVLLSERYVVFLQILVPVLYIQIQMFLIYYFAFSC